MIVDITDTAVVLTEPDDCRRFHVRVPSSVPMASLGRRPGRRRRRPR